MLRSSSGFSIAFEAGMISHMQQRASLEDGRKNSVIRAYTLPCWMFVAWTPMPPDESEDMPKALTAVRGSTGRKGKATTYSVCFRNFSKEIEMKLKNKVAFVTGGTSGIGLESAKLFVAEGAKVAIVGVNAERLKAAGDELGSDVLLVQADVRKVADIERAVQETVSKFGHLDVVFANAGASTVAPLEAVTPEYFHDNVALNFAGTFFTIQKTAPHVRKGGSIIVTTSFLTAMGKPGLSVLAATKAAARSLVRTLGAELAPRGIRVNAVSPGAIATPFYGKMGLSEAQLSDVAAGLQEQIGLKRFGEPKELAHAVLYLASDDSSYTTGSELVVDGGLTEF
ncbi:SDR family oxidoreductase [Paraburkholderia hospita]|jgi:NAD(P)-dependent dehydrogenase (short-subunit alcohol dehydrogenase family)|uniref:SDR family oxidoreductase n=1 Tax=Paraburkholderia hospita TaxID=169430 RepID=UPI0002E37B7B|nr:SDR family oxidoreductase [Paraburkholderia hospita]